MEKHKFTNKHLDLAEDSDCFHKNKKLKIQKSPNLASLNIIMPNNIINSPNTIYYQGISNDIFNKQSNFSNLINSNGVKTSITNNKIGSGAKKLIIKNLKDKPDTHNNYQPEIMNKLKNAIMAVNENRAVKCTLEELYQGVEILCAQNMAPQLYQELKTICENYVLSNIEKYKGYPFF
ncbi:unnamed protein product [Gordionus sp. m RMFG-2023]